VPCASWFRSAESFRGWVESLLLDHWDLDRGLDVYALVTETVTLVSRLPLDIPMPWGVKIAPFNKNTLAYHTKIKVKKGHTTSLALIKGDFVLVMR
jgi:hypothetical protein